jgi:hypothetical protein
MAKAEKKLDFAQLDLFEAAKELALKQGELSNIVDDTMNIDSTIRELITKALKQTSKSRYHVAAEMSESLGLEISKFQIDSWSAESKDGHRFPLQYLPAFCKATGDKSIIRFISQKMGGLFIDGPETLYLELGKCESEGKQLQKRAKLYRDLLQIRETK